MPRSFLASTDNRLVLFEEFRGNPSSVTFQTVTVGNACANAREGYTLELSCQGRAISGIKFASFGDPQGTCGKPFATGSQVFEKGTCEAADSLSIIQKVMNQYPFIISYRLMSFRLSAEFLCFGLLLFALWMAVMCWQIQLFH